MTRREHYLYYEASRLAKLAMGKNVSDHNSRMVDHALCKRPPWRHDGRK